MILREGLRGGREPGVGKRCGQSLFGFDAATGVTGIELGQTSIHKGQYPQAHDFDMER